MNGGNKPNEASPLCDKVVFNKVNLCQKNINDLFSLFVQVSSTDYYVSNWFSSPQVKPALGGRVRLILSGVTPLATHVEAYLRVVVCCYVLQGYGIWP